MSKDDDDVWMVVFDPPVEFDSLLVIIVRAGLTTDAQFSNVTLKGCVKGRWNSLVKILKFFECKTVDIFLPVFSVLQRTVSLRRLF